MESVVALMAYARINATVTRTIGNSTQNRAILEFSASEYQFKTVIGLLNLASNNAIHYVAQLNDLPVQRVYAIQLTIRHTHGLITVAPRNVAQLMSIIASLAFYQAYRPDDAQISLPFYMRALSVLQVQETVGSGFNNLREDADELDDLSIHVKMLINVAEADVRPLEMRSGFWQHAIDLNNLLDDEVYAEYIRRNAIREQLVPFNYIFESFRARNSNFFRASSEIARLRILLDSINATLNLDFEI